jgi:hypothetical protein
MPKEYSQNIWDYLSETQYMPSREDRDELKRAAAADPKNAKRVFLWDYFFRLRSEDVGKSLQQELLRLRRQMDSLDSDQSKARQVIEIEFKQKKDNIEIKYARQIDEIGLRYYELEQQRNNANRRRRSQLAQRVTWGILCMLAGIGVFFLPAFVEDRFHIQIQVYALYVGLFLLGLGLLLLILGSLRSAWPQPELPDVERERKAQQAQMQAELAQLENERLVALETNENRFDTRYTQTEAAIGEIERLLEQLREQTPVLPRDLDVYLWLQEDLRSLANQGRERIKRNAKEWLLDLDEASNPLCILGPAELQAPAQIPPPFTMYPDRLHHLRARQFCQLPDGSFADFYGVYNVEFLYIGADALMSYGFYFDFISGKVTGERIAEQNYHNIASFGLRYDFREVTLTGSDGSSTAVMVEDIPTFSLSLASGEVREVTLACPNYFQRLREQLGAETLPFDPARWANDPQRTVEAALQVLRQQTRLHSNLSSEGG